MDKTKKAKVLSINTLLFTSSNLGTRILSFLLVPLYTFVLSTEDYGKLDLVSTTVQLLIPILTLNIQDAVLRFCLDKEYAPSQSLKVGFRLARLASIILGFSLLITNSIGILPLEPMYLIYLFLSFTLNAFYVVFSMYLKAVNKVKTLVICGILNTLITCSLNILLLLVIKLGVMGFLIANISAATVSIIIMLISGRIFDAIRVDIPKGLTTTMIVYSLPLIVNSVSWWLNNASDRYILTFFYGAAINGIYAIAYKIPSILSSVQSVFYNAWSISAITDFDENDSDGFLGNVYMTYCCVSIVGCSFIMLFNVFLARILYAKEFFTAWRYVPPLLVGTVFCGIALFEGCLFVAVKKTKEVSLTTLMGAIVNTIFNFVLIPFIGALGASIATMLGYISIWGIRTIQLRKIIQIQVEWFVLIAGLSLLLIQCAVGLLFSTFFWQLPIFCIILFSQRKYYARVIRMIKERIANRHS